MKKIIACLALAAVASLSTSCAYMGGGTDLSDVADGVGFSNVTTGDGTFENYTATGYYTGMEIGIAVGLPFLCKFIELYPARTNEQLLGDVAQAAKDDGANAMINVIPVKEQYLGFPFGIVGLYMDTTAGTGISTR